MRTIKTLAALMAAAAALLFVTPTNAAAQVSTQAVADCTDCYTCNILFPVAHDANLGTEENTKNLSDP